MPHARVTIDAGADPELVNRSFGATMVFDQPAVAERAMYFGTTPLFSGGHEAAGATGLAEGRVGGPNGYQSYILLANSETLPASVTLTFLRTNDKTLVKTFAVQPTSRFNVAVTGPGSDVPELADESFGTLIESTVPIVVERSMHANANGIVWAAGTNATATKLP